MRATLAYERLVQITQELALLKGTPRSNRVAHNHKSALYRRRKKLMQVVVTALEARPSGLPN